jgi:hypothetical protein
MVKYGSKSWTSDGKDKIQVAQTRTLKGPLAGYIWTEMRCSRQNS